MWARTVELMLGLWLLISPFVFGHAREDVRGWTLDLACGAAIVVLAALGHWRKTRRAHLGQLVIALFLIGHGWWYAGPPAEANRLTAGLLLAMLAVVPPDATEPPARWREHEARSRERERIAAGR